MSDPVNRPAHYLGHPAGIECVEISERLSSALGQAWQYIWRAPGKGATLEDYAKAIWWLRRERQRLATPGTMAAVGDAPPYRIADIVQPFAPLPGEALAAIHRLAWEGGNATDCIDLAIRLVEMARMEASA